MSQTTRPHRARDRAPRTEEPTRSSPATRAPGRASRARSASLAGVLGFLAVTSLGGVVAWSVGCGSSSSDGDSAGGLTEPAAPRTIAARPSATASAEAAPTAAPSTSVAVEVEPPAPLDDPEHPKAPEPYVGPLLGALGQQTPIYPEMNFGKPRIGYIRLGGKVPVDPTPIKKDNCKQGWYKLVDGGYVCGKYATTNVEDSRVRLGIHAPDFEDLLPYKYAYNSKHGTPLYRSVPSRSEMLEYEPYLKETKKKDADGAKSDKSADAKASAAPSASSSAGAPSASAVASAEPSVKKVDDLAGQAARTLTASASAIDKAAGATIDDSPAPVRSDAADRASAAAESQAIGLIPDAIAEEPPPEQPWWQKTYEKGEKPKITLEDLETERDSTLAKRMVKGFFVAVDKTFRWNNRAWYKTTGGLVAPADRMFINKPPDSKGLDFPKDAKQVGFILKTKASKYELDADHTKAKVKGTIDRFSGFGLTGETAEVSKTLYRETTEGWWMRDKDGTITEPDKRPEGVKADEKWVDVNITRNTLVLFVGDTPVYAALVSPGRRSKIKKKNHATPTGSWRIREKHVAATMDGNGTAAGDLPYSIEDVPYVEYYKGSYALHAAFWHSNFGREMSHGCVNLSPIDAKRVFLWTEPQLPRGWHGVWSTDERPGSLVNVHG